MLALMILGALCFGLLIRIGYKIADLPNACVLPLPIIILLCEPRVTVTDYILFATTVVGVYLPSWMKINLFDEAGDKIKEYLEKRE